MSLYPEGVVYHSPGFLTLVDQTTSVVDLIGGAGWGSFGLAGLVLAWLFFWYLPAMHKKVDDFVALVVKQHDSCQAEKAEMQARFDARAAEMGRRLNELRETLLQLWEHHERGRSEPPRG